MWESVAGGQARLAAQTAISTRLHMASVWIDDGARPIGIAFVSGAAAVTPTTMWAALYSDAGLLVAQTPDLGGGAVWAASSVKDFLFSAPLGPLVGGRYWAGVQQTAVTAATLMASSKVAAALIPVFRTLCGAAPCQDLVVPGSVAPASFNPATNSLFSGWVPYATVHI